MADADYKQLIKQWLEDVNRHDIEAFDRYLTDDFVEHEEAPFIEGNGPEAPKQFFGMLFAAFSDLRMDLEDTIVEGDKVVIRWHMRGTHDGEFMGIPATHKTIDVQGIDVLRMEGEKAAEHWGVTDQMAMMQQLGLVPEASPA